MASSKKPEGSGPTQRLGGPRELSARQAAARLGVKVETIYAYVSRGLLERLPGPDGRSSIFEAKAVERLARKRSGGAKSGGLSVVLGTGITLIEEDRVCYRGLDAGALAKTASFEAVAEWLWLGEQRPDAADGEASLWRSPEGALEVARAAQESMPAGVATADRLRAVASLVAPGDPFRFDREPRAVVECGRRLLSVLVDGLPLRGARVEAPLVLSENAPLLESVAARLWPRLTETVAREGALAAINAALVLVADHGLAASTLAARVAASVRADPYSIIAAGLATLSGPLHGAASAPVHRLLEQVGRPERAVAVLGDHLRRQERIPGFGHLIYRGWDPRARVLLELVRSADLDPQKVAVIERVLEILEEHAPVRPNIDFVIGSLSYAANMDEGAGEAIFGVARSAGWLAHALEEYDEPALRFRPRAHYVGPPAG